MKNFNAIINGKEIITPNTLEIISPVTNQPFAKVSALTKEDINNAYAVAKQTQKDWEKIDIKERAQYLLAWCKLLNKNLEHLTNLIVMEVGKNAKDAKTEIIRSIEYIEYTIEEAYRIQPKAMSAAGFPNGNTNKTAIITQVPVGVVCAISPFNYPVNLSIAKIAPALIMGNSVVFKPATNGSAVGIEIIRLLHQTNIMPGVINCVTGRGREIGDDLVTNPNLDFISFTGGTSTGKHISSLVSLKPQVMELGGKDAAIVIDDNNLEAIAKDIIQGAFNYSGQRCTATKRVIVLDHIADKLTSYLKAFAAQLPTGSALENNEIIPLIDSGSADYVEGLIKDAVDKNAVLVTGGQRENNLIYATIVDFVTSDMRLYYEEPFGPALPIIRVNSIEEAIKVHNDSTFGLQASVYSTNIDTLFNMANRLETGTVNFNAKSSRGPDSFPFIGVKDSGLGVQGINDSLISMTRPKITVINISPK